jgi:hypothetical protein
MTEGGMRESQRGVTFIGWVFLLVPLAIVGYALIRITPVYLTYMSVSKIMDQLTKDTPAGSQFSAAELRVSIDKRLDIEGINSPTSKDIDIHRDGDHWVAIADYEEVAPLFGNVSLLAQFHKQVTLQ